MVYVISKKGKPLMPCKNVVARLLLKEKKAKVISKCPFVIKLNYTTTEYKQDVTLGIDTGSAHIGCAAVSDGNVIYMSQVEVRNDIKSKMDDRRKYRRNRRNRKTRYRKARWLNRANSIREDRFSPTMVSKLHSHKKEIEYVKSILPVTQMVFETGNFDCHLMKNPALQNENVRHWGYQKGANYGFANTKARVLFRDDYTCQQCKTKKGTLEVHHIIFRCQGGSDEAENLITLCHDCHWKVHNKGLRLKLKGSKKGFLSYATQMNSIRVQLLKAYPDAIETFGFVTKTNRLSEGLPKQHYFDAVMIASGGNSVSFKSNNFYHKVCISDGDYQKTKGVRSEQRLPDGKICGFKKFDKVSYLGNEYFIKGRMSSGYAVLMDIGGNKIDFSSQPKGFKTPKLKNCKRVQARKSWIITESVIQNIA